MGTFWRMFLVHFCNVRRNSAINFMVSGADLFHASQHLANPATNVSLAATIYDMSCWTFPETHTAANVAATKAYAERILRVCDGLIAI